jgi:hypothetical protein
MSILPTHNVQNLFTTEEIDAVNQYVVSNGQYNIDDTDSYPDSGRNGKNAGRVIATKIHWNYHQHLEVEKILTPKLEHVLQKKLMVTESHILESKIPYLIHNDFIHHNNQGSNPEYTILIPLDTYNSITVCFNEWAENYNDFEIFKQNYSGETKLKMDPKFCANRLSHLHPMDLKYLTLHDTFAWNKGSVFAMDRRYFHCSDNFSKRGLVQKRAIVLWTIS